MKIEISKDGVITKVSPIKTGDSVVIPKEVNGIKVTRLLPRLFAYKKATFTVKVEAEINSVTESCFASSGVVAVSLPTSCKGIGDAAFKNCHMLRSITAYDLDYIGNNAFYAVKANFGIVSCKRIHSGAFYRATFLEKPNFLENNGLRHIGEYAFSHCVLNDSLKLPATLEKIYASAFNDCTISGLTLPAKKLWLGSRCFSNLTNLKEFKWDWEPATLPNSFLSGCFNLSKLSLNTEKVKTIGLNAFHNCKDLSGEMRFPRVNVVNGGAFEGCESLDVYINDKAKAIQTTSPILFIL